MKTPKYLTKEEIKLWNCKALLPAPGNEVVAELLTTISNLRGELDDISRELVRIRGSL